MIPNRPNDRPAHPSDGHVRITKTDTFREGYANSVQVKMSVWDFQLVFGTLQGDSAEEIHLAHFQGIYISPQQAKALWSVLGQNLAQYENTFGKLHLEPQNAPTPQPGGPVN